MDKMLQKKDEIRDTRPKKDTKLKRRTKQTSLRDGFISLKEEETLDSFEG